MEDSLRPNVKKYLPQFIEYMKIHGAETVFKVLDKGKCGTLRLTFPLNKKDRFQMIRTLNKTKEIG